MARINSGILWLEAQIDLIGPVARQAITTRKRQSSRSRDTQTLGLSSQLVLWAVPELSRIVQCTSSSAVQRSVRWHSKTSQILNYPRFSILSEQRR